MDIDIATIICEFNSKCGQPIACGSMQDDPPTVLVYATTVPPLRRPSWRRCSDLVEQGDLLTKDATNDER
jgi:hypothetical protein